MDREAGDKEYSPTSRYWMFRRGLRSDLTTLCDCSTRCCRNISVATVITKAALLEQLLMSSSCEMIFLTRATNDVLDVCYVDNSGRRYGDCSSEEILRGYR